MFSVCAFSRSPEHRRFGSSVQVIVWSFLSLNAHNAPKKEGDACNFEVRLLLNRPLTHRLSVAETLVFTGISQ